MKKIVLSALIASTLVIAAEEVDPNQLVTHTELGYIETQGNTRTQTFNVAAKAEKNFDKHEFDLVFNAQYATDETLKSATNENGESKNKYDTELNYSYAFTKRLGFGYVVGYKYDKFSSFDYQAYTGPSVKYKVIKTDNQKLNLSANILWAQDDYRDVTKDAKDYSAYRAKAVYEWKIKQDLKFTQDLGYRASMEDSKDYFANSKSSLTSKISDIFSAGLSYQVDYVNQPQGFEYTDRTFIANLIIDY